MRLTAIEVQGFKSFAHKTRLEFGGGVTAIVGPNGSGKSNMAEAVRWVLGEQSLKSLRGKQSADVIFSGADGTSQAAKARVTLTFDNESGRFPLEVSEVAVSRVLGRGGESEYLVNGEPVRLLELQQMLAEAGIGARSYTVISQGMVDRYLTATPEGRRELFDEATGVRALQLKMQQADKKLRSTREHAHEVQMIMSELDPRLRVLARQVKRQEERDVLAGEFEVKQRHWFLSQWHQAQTAVHRWEAALEAARAGIAAASEERKRVEAAVFAAAARQAGPHDHIRGQVQAAEAEYAADTAAYEKNMALLTQLTAALAAAKQELAWAEGQLAQARQKHDGFDWLASVRALLKQCREVMAGTAEHDAAKVLGEVDSFLTRIQDMSSIDMARSVLHEMEAPLQAVARCRAIIEERERQITGMSNLETPSDGKIVRLRAMLESQPGSTPRDLPAGRQDSPQAQLEDTREAEIAAEREGSAAEGALSGSRQDLARIEQAILREAGSAVLAVIQQSNPAELKHEKYPSEEELRSLSARIASLGEIDDLAVKEYAEVKERFSYLEGQMHDVTQTEQNILQLKGELETAIVHNFGRQFAVISDAFAEYFQKLFGGGRAELAQTEAGVAITVAPPGKRERSVALLSGGEKALTSLALLLAIIDAQRPPFIVLDEVDAALDEVNSERLADILRDKAAATQCIVISHNRSTMSAAKVLYGVTMQADGVSKVYSVRLSDIELIETGQAIEEKISA